GKHPHQTQQTGRGGDRAAPFASDLRAHSSPRSSVRRLVRAPARRGATTQTGVERRRSAPEGCGEPLETHERARVANSAFGKRSRGGAAFARTYQGSRAAPHGGVQGARTGRE